MTKIVIIVGRGMVSEVRSNVSGIDLEIIDLDSQEDDAEDLAARIDGAEIKCPFVLA